MSRTRQPPEVEESNKELLEAKIAYLRKHNKDQDINGKDMKLLEKRIRNCSSRAEGYFTPSRIPTIDNDRNEYVRLTIQSNNYDKSCIPWFTGGKSRRHKTKRRKHCKKTKRRR